MSCLAGNINIPNTKNIIDSMLSLTTVFSFIFFGKENSFWLFSFLSFFIIINAFDIKKLYHEENLILSKINLKENIKDKMYFKYKGQNI